MSEERVRGPEPVRKTVEVAAPREEAFRTFTEDMGAWWPLATHSVYEDDAVACVFEPRLGGRIFERHRDGREANWGEVVAWDPPARVAFTWHPGREPETAQEVEVRFDAFEAGTRVSLEHRGWERLGDRAAGIREGYQTGWDPVLARYGGRAGGRP